VNDSPTNDEADLVMEYELTEIARRVLRLVTLEERKSDRLDFHDLGVGQIKEALWAAYRAGQKAR
jgi:hypothetical protein